MIDEENFTPEEISWANLQIQNMIIEQCAKIGDFITIIACHPLLMEAVDTIADDPDFHVTRLETGLIKVERVG